MPSMARPASTSLYSPEWGHYGGSQGSLACFCALRPNVLWPAEGQGIQGSSSPLWPPVCADHHESLLAREPGFACSIFTPSDIPQPVLWTQPTTLCHVTAGLLMEISKASDKQTKRTRAGKAIKRPHPVLPSSTDDAGARLASLAQNPPNSPCEKCAQRKHTGSELYTER